MLQALSQQPQGGLMPGQGQFAKPGAMGLPAAQMNALAAALMGRTGLPMQPPKRRYPLDDEKRWEALSTNTCFR